MTDIKPALTPDEWRTGRVGPVWRRQDGVIAITQPDPPGVGSNFPAHLACPIEHEHAMIALLNAALMDDDPRKITRADVEYIRDVAEDYRYRGLPVFDDVHALAAKLAALLPP